MADVFTQAKRSQVMSRIRGHGNKQTEIALIRLLRRHHITGWRRDQAVFGKPDFLFRKARVAVFVDGCFWHGCSIHCKTPASNCAFWEKKLAANKARDRRVNRVLRKEGWHVLRIWEHELVRKNETHLVRRIQRAMGAFIAGPAKQSTAAEAPPPVSN